MARRKRPEATIIGAREAGALAATLGGGLRQARRHIKLTQTELASKVGLSQSRYSEVERGLGAALPLDTWVSLGIAIERPLAVSFSRPTGEDRIVDAGHLAMQELLLRLARETGRRATFELATRPAEPWRSTDVGVRDDTHRVLILEEAWNTFGDVGAARRSTSRKHAEAERLAIAIGGDRPYRVASVWIVRATEANRGLISRYPAVFASACPGSSLDWVRALVDGDAPPEAIGLVWCDPIAGSVFAWRRRRPQEKGGA
ncbi:MAG TPA: helix-turn-helix transcriptional regulator [Candidatus Limnocylindrales bacterium]|nr:helix-turn-helix transcriptional regulator [Candidatus Limnocylindrales bacterium]